MKIALIGYGKMGHMIEEIALQRGHEIVCKIDVNTAPSSARQMSPSSLPTLQLPMATISRPSPTMSRW